MDGVVVYFIGSIVLSFKWKHVNHSITCHYERFKGRYGYDYVDNYELYACYYNICTCHGANGRYLRPKEALYQRFYYFYHWFAFVWAFRHRNSVIGFQGGTGDRRLSDYSKRCTYSSRCFPKK